MVVETLVFIPYTKDSVVRRKMQEADNLIAEAKRTPGIRFVERCGGATIAELLGRSNPWAKMWECGRQQCLPCQGRALLAQEVEELEMAEQDPQSPPKPRPGREDTTSLPKCTTESVGYHLECWRCRKEGKKVVYVGETSRSPYQRGKEH